MATPDALRTYRRLYEVLLRLYPRGFRERFGEGMAQTFSDLCGEHSGTRARLLAFAVWMYCETSAGIVKENAMQFSPMGKTTLRVALGALAALMVPLVASRLVPGWNWSAGSFVFVYVLFFLLGMAIVLISRRMGVWSYKLGVAVALFTGFALGWSNMVHVADSENPAALWFYAVLVVGLIGAALARLKARGLEWTLFAMAATYVALAIMIPPPPQPELAQNMIFGHVGCVVLLTAAGFLFRHASLAETR